MIDDQKPPLFKNWSSWYWIVLTVMLVQVIVFLWLTNSFS
jgi:Mg2+ and Co2+ transporter CorA